MRFDDVNEWKRQYDAERRNRAIAKKSCPYCGASLTFTVFDSDKSSFFCTVCGGEMPFGGGGGGGGYGGDGGSGGGGGGNGNNGAAGNNSGNGNYYTCTKEA